MSTIEARGFVKRVEMKTSAKGSEYARFTLAVGQKRREKGGVDVKETLYFNCTDFDPRDVPAEGEYIGVTGYVTLSRWEGGKDGKGGINVDISVKSYEKLPQKDNGSRGAPAASGDAAPPSDPFALSPGKP